MATITKTAASSWGPATGWSAAPTRTQDGVVNATAGAGPFTLSNTVELSSLWIQPDASSFTVTSGSFSTILFTGTSPPSGYTFYLAGNKSLTLGLNLAFQNTLNSTHSVYIDNGSTLNANCVAAVTANTNTVRKYGAGTWITATTEFSGTSSSNIGAWELYEGILGTGISGTAQALGTATIGFFGGTLQVRSSRTFNNTITVNAAGGTITTNSGVTATINNAASGGGVLTVAGAGNVAWNNDISCPLNVTGLLTMAASRNLSGTLSGIGGTIAMSGGTISGDAPTFTGDVTGAFTYNASGGKTFGGNAQGTVTVTGGTLTATASNSGTIANISGGAGVTLSSNGTFTGDLTGYTYLGQLPTAGVATFSMVGSTATFARNLSLTNGSNVRLSNSATLASPIVVTNITSNTSSMTVEDATTNTFTGSYISDGSAGSDNVSVKTGGTLVVSGSIDGRRSDRVWNLNNADGYAGTIRITGVGFYNSLGNAPTAAHAFLKRGKIQFARAGVSYLAGGLTVESGSTIACAASNAAYAAQLSGNLTLSAGSFMKFGTA